MHIIIVHQNPSITGGPEAICTRKLINALADENFKISIVSRNDVKCDFSNENIQCFSVGKGRLASQESLFEKFSRNLQFYPESGWFWALAAAKKIDELCRADKIDLLHTRAMPFISHISGWKSECVGRIPWLAHFSDPWPDTDSFGEKKSNLRMRWHRKILPKCSAVSYPCQRVAEYCKKNQWGKLDDQHFPREIILPHIAGEISGNPASAQQGKSQFIFLHCGSFTERRRPDEFIAAWAEFVKAQPENRRHLIFRHVGPFDSRLEKFANEYGVSDTIEQLGPCDYPRSLQFMAEASVLVLIDSPLIKTSLFFPSKLSDYVAANKPILAFSPKDGTVADLLGEDYPFLAAPWDVQSMQNVLKDSLVDLLRGEWRGEKSTIKLKQECNPRGVARKIIELLNYWGQVVALNPKAEEH
jgi:glycosyltransferase involved in cell wall biosynthesis